MQRFFLLITLLSLTPLSQADWLGGVDFGAYSWNPTIEGNLGNGGLDTQTELGLNNSSNTTAWIGIEYFGIGWLPNAKFETTSISSNGNGLINGNKNLQNISLSGSVNSHFDLDTNDISLYYEVLDNYLSLDLGLTLRHYEGEISVQQNVGTARETTRFDSLVPLAYLNAKIHLPLSGVYMGATFNGIQYDRSNVVDSTLRLGYEYEISHFIYIAADIGYRRQQIELVNIDNFNTDTVLRGGFTGINMRLAF